MDIASSRPQNATEILMDTQTEIKEIIKWALFNVYYMISFNDKVNEVIKKNLSEIKDDTLREDCVIALRSFAKKEYQMLVVMLNLGNLPILLAFSNIKKNKINLGHIQSSINQNIEQITRCDVNKAFSHLGNSQAMISNHQSVYGRSEMVLRFERQQKMVEELYNKTNLVICDTHADCSDRCQKWQGRIYSLDGTYGKTEDGKDYIPLEVARNAMFKGHKNGLLGYNCRHKLYPYKTGMRAVKVSKEQQQREYKLTQKQRILEREIRNFKDLAFSFKGIDSDRYKYYKNKTLLLTAQYKEFCKSNNRVEYRSRLKI